MNTLIEAAREVLATCVPSDAQPMRGHAALDALQAVVDAGDPVRDALVEMWAQDDAVRSMWCGKREADYTVVLFQCREDAQIWLENRIEAGDDVDIFALEGAAFCSPKFEGWSVYPKSVQRELESRAALALAGKEVA